MIRLFLILGFFFLIPVLTEAQVCTTPGQNPSTAFPVCGTTVFKQSQVPACVTHNLKVPGCSNSGSSYEDRNPFWYKFTCYESGTLGFLIKPLGSDEDYDWQLYDITGRNPDDVFDDISMVVTGNWAGSYGNTGASNSGVSFIQCGSNPTENKNTFAKMPELKAGHTYLLLISHFTDSQSGYDLSFGGGTAVITDTTQPHLKIIEANCTGDVLRVKLNKKIKCSSIAANGSDFTLTSTDATITGTSGFDCNVRFDTDSLILQLSKPLAPGTYTLGIQKGGDGNTLLDYCDNEVPLTDALQIAILPKQPTPMDSMVPVTCAPQQLRLVFQKPIRCASVAADGSDFVVSGTYPVQITTVEGACANGLTKEILVTLNAPLKQAGTFRLALQRGTDGNTLIDECGLETPANSLSFAVKDTVNALFTYSIKYGCVRDTIAVFHNGANGVTSWQWDLDDRQRSTSQAAQGIYTLFEEKIVTLVASNGFCSDSASQAIMLDNFLKADFVAFEDNCPNEPITFTGAAQGKIKTHAWEFGDGGTANAQITSYAFSVPDRQRTYQVKYTVTDSFGCQNTAAKPVTIYPNCFIAVPTGFTPNSDGLNDYLAPLNAVKATDLEFRVYNRWGQLLYAASNWKLGWNGTYKGTPQPSGTYVWILRYTHRETGKKLEQKGTVVLIR